MILLNDVFRTLDVFLLPKSEYETCSFFLLILLKKQNLFSFRKF
nr:MAG TPA: hypothetical protein [Bacteriophage sp.]